MVRDDQPLNRRAWPKRLLLLTIALSSACNGYGVQALEPQVERDTGAQVMLTAVDSFDEVVFQTLVAGLTGDTAAAQEKLELAKAMNPNRHEIAVLEDLLSGHGNPDLYQTVISTTSLLSSEKRWFDASTLAKAGLSRYPDDQVLQAAVLAATQISDAQKEIALLMANEERFASEHFRKKAEKRAQELATLQGRFAPLDEALSSLLKTLQTYSTPIEVQLVSDGQTDITVKFTGYVGKTTGRSIQLTPGTYEFTGTREKHKNCYKEVVIHAKQSKQRVEFICDQPL